jgi:hypothetical protein
MSRKTLMFVLAIVMAVLGLFKTEFGLQMDVAGLVGGITLLLTYVFFEAKLDILRIRQQKGKWSDPKFWVSFILAIVTALNANLGWHIPVEIVSAIAFSIITALFKLFKIQSSTD